MNRGYTRERYLELIDDLRDAVPTIALSTDLIVGFPGETEEDFAATLEMVRYSPRPGTPAASMPDQIEPAVKARRNAALLEVTQRVAATRSARLAGRVMDVLVDGPSRKDPRALSARALGSDGVQPGGELRRDRRGRAR
jgi:tRNA-2-methylthio-N6-dimethylallyladenosine synthase